MNTIYLGKQARKAIQKAIQQIERYTCIQFSPWNKEHDFVEFIKDEGYVIILTLNALQLRKKLINNVLQKNCHDEFGHFDTFIFTLQASKNITSVLIKTLCLSCYCISYLFISLDASLVLVDRADAKRFPLGLDANLLPRLFMNFFMHLACFMSKRDWIEIYM